MVVLACGQKCWEAVTPNSYNGILAFKGPVENSTLWARHLLLLLEI